MKSRTKILMSIGLWLLCIWGSFAAYQYQDSIKRIFTAGYSSDYTFEEVNQKILSLQQKSVSQIQEQYEKQLELWKQKNIKGSFGVSGAANSSFWGGKWNFSLWNIQVQYDENNFDLLLEDIIAAWDFKVFWEEQSENISLGSLHLLWNASGSYITSKDIQIESRWVLWEIVPAEILMTLNKLGASDTYVNLSENFVFQIMQAQLNAQKEASMWVQQTFLDFIENEALLEVYKQEETKYTLAPSKAMCKLSKSEKEKSQDETENSAGLMFWSMSYEKPEPLTYEVFKNEYIDCTNEEYTEFVEKMFTSDMHTIHQAYIELSPTKLHYVFDADLKSPKTDLELTVNMWSEAVISLTESVESSKTYFTIDNPNVTGSGFLIEQTDDMVNGYLDIDMPKYNLDTNLSFSGTNENMIIEWDYSYKAPSEIPQREFAMLKDLELSWTLSWNLWETSKIEFKNSFNQAEFWFSGNFDTIMNMTLKDDTTSWDITYTGTLKMWENASPMSGEINISWDMQHNKNLAKWNIQYNLEIPNIASWNYDIAYDFTLSDTPETDFASPEKVVAQKSLDMMIKINKSNIEKEKAEKMKLLIEKIENGEEVDYNKEFGISSWTLGQYNLDAKNSKITSDLRTLASAIEISLTMWDVGFIDLVDNSAPIETNGWVLYDGGINYNNLKLNQNDFQSPFWIPYQIRVFTVETDKEDYSFYQVSWYKLSNNKLERVTKWNYIQLNPDMPKSLFDIEVK